MKLWKKVVIVLAIVLALGAARRALWPNPCAQLLYPRAARIVGVEYDNDLYIIEDEAGLIWLWKGVGDLTCGDHIALLMFNGLTPWTVHDDVILDIG